MNARITIDRDLPQPSWKAPAEPVDLIRYVGGGKLTFGTYASAEAAMLASDVPTWIGTGNGEYRSQDGRTLIERVRT